ncbi:MAG: glycosyltransferase family 2 protein [Spirochaetales bacterium]|nr:glycosyltransferase family 2 protein [Spirochaetales bacterium]
MKLIIQIPCFNEEETLPVTLKDLPREIPGIDKVEWLIINDGSRDRTVEVAKACGVDHIVSFTKNRGLAEGFRKGLDACLSLGADIIVNTDADNQYDASCIPDLVEPIISGKADIVVGARPIADIDDFSFIKKKLQKLGSKVMRTISGTNVQDAPSGFRAFSREAAMRLNVYSEYTYTLETIIQAGAKNLNIVNVPIKTNGMTRPSRLFKSMTSYIRRSIKTMIWVRIIYKPFPFFFNKGLLSFIAGAILGLRYLVFMFSGDGGGHTQSLILSSILILFGATMMLVAFLADLLAVNRKLLEDIKYNQLKERK